MPTLLSVLTLLAAAVPAPDAPDQGAVAPPPAVTPAPAEPAPAAPLPMPLPAAPETQAAAPPAAATAVLPDDLGSLELDDSGGASDEGPKVDLFGFASTGFYKPLVSSNNKWLQYFPADSTFVMSNVNLYVATTLSPRLRSMIETRLLVVPQGAASVGSNGNVNYLNTETQDPGEFGRFISWAGIVLERAWIDYDLWSGVSVRVGRFLTPYGIWNVDHGAPVIVGIRRPWVIRSQLLPERQTGIEVHGTKVLGPLVGGYHLTLSNGRGPSEAYFDLDSNKAFGARAYLEWRGAGKLILGSSYYQGRYTRPANRWVPSGYPNQYTLQTGIGERYDERAVAADAQYTRGGLLLQSEFVLNDRRYTDPGRPRAIDTASELIPDVRQWGVYGLIGYRFAATSLMPYVNVELFDYGPGANTTTPGLFDKSLGLFVGLNYRPRPDLVLKAEWFRSSYPGADKNSWGSDHFSCLQFEVAWAF